METCSLPMSRLSMQRQLRKRDEVLMQVETGWGRSTGYFTKACSFLSKQRGPGIAAGSRLGAKLLPYVSFKCCRHKWVSRVFPNNSSQTFMAFGSRSEATLLRQIAEA